MPGRDHTEGHPATSLELLYDLVAVIAIAFAATSLHHAINENHAATGILSYVLVFWVIFWPWVGFTWFASQYDTDDTGESLLGLTNGLVHPFEHFSVALLGALVGGFLILFSMWWFYFDEKEHRASFKFVQEKRACKRRRLICSISRVE